VAVRMVFVGVFLAVATSDQNDKVGNQIRERMDAVRHQTLGLGSDTDHDLNAGENDIDHHAHPGAARSRSRALRRCVRAVFGVVVYFGEVHSGFASAAALACKGPLLRVSNLLLGLELSSVA